MKWTDDVWNVRKYKKYDNLDWDAYSFVKRGGARLRVLFLLYNTPYPILIADVAVLLNIKAPHAAFVLSEFEKAGIANELSNMKRGKIYVITQKGIDIMNFEKYWEGKRGKR